MSLAEVQQGQAQSLQPTASTPTPSNKQTLSQQRQQGYIVRHRPMPKPYQEIYQQIQNQKTQIMLDPSLSPQQKAQEIQQLNTTQRDVQQFEKQKYIAEKTPQGYTFTEPQKSPLEWARYQAEQSKKLPLGLREISMFGQGLQSSLYSVVSPVAGVVGKQQEFDVMTSIAMSGSQPWRQREYLSGSLQASSQGVHYPSTFDFALEPLGFSPKGTTDFLLENPAFAAGGVGGEVAQGIVAGQAFRVVGRASKAGIKYVLPKTTSRLSRIAPRTIQRLSETRIGKNVGSFIKGNEPVSIGTERVVSSGSAKTIDGATTITRIGREFKVVPKRSWLFTERKFIPKDIIKKSVSPSKEITMIMRPSTKEATILFEETGVKKGVLRGFRKTYSQVKITSRYGKTYIESGLKPKHGSLYNLQNQKYIRPLTESELALEHPKVNWLYTKVIPHQRGRGIPIAVRQTTKTGEEASGSLIGRQIETTRMVKTSGKTLGYKSEVESFLPESAIMRGLGETSVYLLGRSMLHEKKRLHRPVEKILPVQSQEKTSIVRQMQRRIVIPGVMQKTIQQTDNDLKTIPKIIQREKTGKAMSYKKTSQYRQTAVPLPPFIFPFDMFGRGKTGGYGQKAMLEYKFRKAKIGLPFDIVKDMKKIGL
jgi:hypothetical protein